MNESMEKYIAKISSGVKVFLAVMVTIGAGLGIYAMKTIEFYDSGFYTFLFVMYWIAVALEIVCLGLKLVVKLSAANVASAQQQYSQPAQPVQAPVGGEKFCQNCGAKVTGSSQFCSVCGNKVQ